MPITFNIVSCCICRDIFRLNPCAEFKVDKFVQSVSPISMIDNSKTESLFTIEDLDVFDWTNFIKRNFYFDFHWGGVENFISKDAISDYLILDLCELRFEPTKLVFPNGKEIFVTGTTFLKQFSEKFSNFKQFNNCKIKEIVFSEKELDEVLDNYMLFFKKYYKDKQIILIENYPVQKLIDNENHEIFRYNINTILKTKKLLKHCYDYIKNNYTNINVIETPENSLGDVQHLWGKGALHLVDEYYEYLFKAIKIITSNENDTKAKLSNLKNDYIKYFDLLEKQKRMEYLLYNSPSFSLIPNSKLKCDKKGTLTSWKLSLSQNSNYNKESHLLSCGNEKNNWAILSQNLDKEEFKNQNLTFSVKYKTFDDSILNIALIGQSDSQKDYIIVKQAHNNNFDIESITFKLLNIEKYESLNISTFLNKANHKAIIYETKLELGNYSTLF